MVEGRIEGEQPAVFLSLSESELGRLRAGETLEARNAHRFGLGAVRLQVYGNGRVPDKIEASRPVES